HVRRRQGVPLHAGHMAGRRRRGHPPRGPRDEDLRRHGATAVTEAPGLSKPILPGSAGSDYERYLRTDELLALQKTEAEWIHRDELLFQTVHQSSELWLKLAWNEVEEAAQLVEADDLPAALRLLRRPNDCLKMVTGGLDMLEPRSRCE